MKSYTSLPVESRSRKFTRSLSCLVCLIGFLGPLQAGAQVEFAREIRPILSDACFKCHGVDSSKRKGKLRLDQKEHWFAARDGHALIVPGKPRESTLFQRITHTDHDELMPPPDEVRRLNRILGTFVDGVRRAVLARAGNGAFVTSCPQHSGAQKLGFSKWAIGGVPLRLALRRWWEAPPDAPAEAHAHLPCALRDAPANGSHNCEPSCAKVCKGERPTFGFELPS